MICCYTFSSAGFCSDISGITIHWGRICGCKQPLKLHFPSELACMVCLRFQSWCVRTIKYINGYEWPALSMATSYLGAFSWVALQSLKIRWEKCRDYIWEYKGKPHTHTCAVPFSSFLWRLAGSCLGSAQGSRARIQAWRVLQPRAVASEMLEAQRTGHTCSIDQSKQGGWATGISIRLGQSRNVILAANHQGSCCASQ